MLEKLKASWKKILVTVLIALAAAAAITALVIFAIIPLLRYQRAEKLLSQGDVAGAYDTFDRLHGFRNADKRKEELQDSAVKSRPMDTVKFGGYDWLVLEVRGGKMLLLMKDALQMQPFNEVFTDVSWEDCTLRAYLNGAFYDSFAPADRARIAETTVVNSTNAESGTKAGADTVDKIFLLSIAEAKLYFPEESARMARCNGAACYWWLRSPGIYPSTAATVGSDGVIGFMGSGVNYTTRAVRPALWVTAK